MTRISILLVCTGVLGLLLGLPLLLVTVDTEPTPDIHALDCYSQYRQGQILDDRERWTVDETREQWQADQAQKRLEPGCWAKEPFKCGEDCR